MRCLAAGAAPWSDGLIGAREEDPVDETITRVHDAEPLAMVSQIVESETTAVSELAPGPVPEVEAVLSTEVEAFDGLPVDCLVEAEANLRVLLAEHDAANLEATDVQHAYLGDAADSLRRIAPDVHLAEG